MDERGRFLTVASTYFLLLSTLIHSTLDKRLLHYRAGWSWWVYKFQRACLCQPSLRPPLKGSIVFCLTLRACVIHSCRESDLHSRQPHSRLRRKGSGKRTDWTKRVLRAGHSTSWIINLSYYIFYSCFFYS